MKILFFIDSLEAGGKERRLVELIKGLSSTNDIKFQVVVMNRQIDYNEIFSLGINIFYLERSTKKDISIFQKFYKICKEFNPDIVHCWDSMTAFYSIPACKLLKIKLINGMIVDYPLKRNILNKHWIRAKFTFAFSNAITGNSEAGLRAYNAPKKKSFIIHNGYNFNRNKQLLDQRLVRESLHIESKYIVAMVATFSRFKDYKTYFTAAEILLKKRQDITFLAIGNQTDSLASTSLIASQNRNYFRLLGKKSGVESLVNAIDIGVLATFTEGISNSIMEYMALGKPVVATSGGGTRELLEDRETGFLIKTSDAEEMANKIDLLLNSPELCHRMGAKGQERIRNFFSIDSMVSKYISLYEGCIKIKKGQQKRACKEHNSNNYN